MIERRLQIERPPIEVWRNLQLLPTWEGIGGLRRLREPVHDEDGHLLGFRYTLTTPLGTVDDRARVRPTVGTERRSMTVAAVAKGLALTMAIDLAATGAAATSAAVSLRADATSRLTRPLASTVLGVLESGFDREHHRLIVRLEGGHDPT